MKRTLYLTSVIALGVISSGYSETFPSDGVMLENATYENAATYQNMGVYEGSVTATAEYDDVLYQIIAGQYLPAGSDTGASCTSGNYCSGLTNATYNEIQNQGLTSCPSSHPNSMVGASSNTQCYTSCTLQGANIAHATAVSGNDYYGDGTDTCGATACENGYHVMEFYKPVVKTGVFGVNEGIDFYDGTFIGANGNPGVTSDDAKLVQKYGLTEPNTFAVNSDMGVFYGRATCQSTGGKNYTKWMAFLDFMDSMEGQDPSWDEVSDELTEIVGNEQEAKLIFNTTLAGERGWLTQDEADKILTLPFFTVPEELSNYKNTDTGEICYMQINGFSPVAQFVEGVGPIQTITSSKWFYAGKADSSEDCATKCANYAVIFALGNFDIDLLLYGMFDKTVVGVCEANEISITWQDADQADIDANNAGMCTYDGEIRTPVKAATKPGKTFKGWRFEKK